MRKIEFPEKTQFLFRPARYKVIYGGRGSGKSWSIARALLLLGAQECHRIVCAREIQKSISDSVHKLLVDQISELGLDGFYRVTESRITGKNGTEFIFVGLRHNVMSVKSLEGATVCWVEEAQTVSKASWDVLIPTIRKEGSEIWVSFNPLLESDNTYQRWVVRPPKQAVVVKMNFTDNPWCPQVLKDEAAHLEETDPDGYLHVWLGNTMSVLDGAIYANELRQVDKDERITRVPYDQSRPVDTYWDLGFGDNTSIWFAQAYPYEFRIIDFLNDSGKGLNHYQQQLQARGYVYGKHYLPHDADNGSVQTGRSIRQLMNSAGFPVEVLPRRPVHEGIEAVRAVFPQCVFDRERCADGLQALRHYVYGEDEKANVGRPDAIAAARQKAPLHNWASHPADAFRTFGMAAKGPAKPKEKRKPLSAGSWMG